mgnify:CR=1 FL=1
MPEIKIRESTNEDIEAILGLIAQAPDALLAVSKAEIQAWIALGHSLVATDASGKVIGHQGLGYWESSHLAELRAAYVDPAARGMGLNTTMKLVMMEKARELYPEAALIGFTEPASKSRGILAKLGFLEMPLDTAPDELFSICPNNCFKKTGVNCGCKIFFKK